MDKAVAVLLVSLYVIPEQIKYQQALPFSLMQHLNASGFPVNVSILCLLREREVFNCWVFIASNFGPKKSQHFWL